MDWNVYALDRFGAQRINQVQGTVKQTGKGRIHPPVVLSVGLRETWLQNIVSYNGDDRGVFQISALYHADFLKAHKGCRTGSYEVSHPNAYDPGYVPTLPAGCEESLNILEENYGYGKKNGIKEGDLTRFAVAAYNAGQVNALKGYRAGHVDMYTTGGDYSADVMSRVPIVIRYLHAHDL